MQYPRSNGD